jgi:hypothetical protein
MFIALKFLASKTGIPNWPKTSIRDRLSGYQELIQNSIDASVVADDLSCTASELRCWMQKCKNNMERRAAKELAKF